MITPGRRVGGNWPMTGDALLRVWTATVAEGTPQALEDHSEVRWLEPGHWFDVAWLPGADLDRARVDAAHCERRAHCSRPQSTAPLSPTAASCP